MLDEPISLTVEALVESESSLPLATITDASNTSAPPAGAHKQRHRRTRSDPSDWLQAARRSAREGDETFPSSTSSNKRAQSRGHGLSPERKRHAPSWLGVEDAPESPKGKKDVPMWTMEEDLFIMEMVEQHGKRWSMIASSMVGRTDNGVRNRWNRMDKARTQGEGEGVRELRGPRYGYRCRRCGLPKRGHTCVALSATGDAAMALGATGDASDVLSSVDKHPSAEGEEGSSLATFQFEGPERERSPSPSDPELEADPEPEAVPEQPPQEKEDCAPPTPAAGTDLVAAGAPALAVRPSEEAIIDEQKLDDFLRDLQLSAGLIPSDLFRPPTEEAPPSPSQGQHSEAFVASLEYLYPGGPDCIVPRSPRHLSVC